MRLRKILASRLTTIVLIVAATVLAIHVIAQNGKEVRADLTADDLYSLSDGTHMILDKMRQEGTAPVTVKLYFSATAGKSLPSFIKDFVVYERYIRSLLKEYETDSEGRVRAQFIDPVPDSDEAQDALDYGLDGKPINQDGDLFFFGLVFETQTGSKEVIDFLWPNQQETIEYEISKRLHNLVWPAKKKIGVLSSLDVLSTADNPYMRQILAAQGKQPHDSWLTMQLLEQSYEVQRLDPDTDHVDPEDVDLLVVIHPKGLNERALWAIDEWVERGGNTLVFVDPYALDDQPPQNPQQPWAGLQYKPASNLAPLFKAWGIERAEDEVAADFDLAVTRPVARGRPPERLLIDLQIDQQHDAETLADHPILQGVKNLRLFLAGALQKTGEGKEGVEYTPLVTTTPKGSTLHMEPGIPEPQGSKLVFADVSNDPAKIRDRFSPGDSPEVLAYLLRGRLPSAYPDGTVIPGEPPPPPPGLPPGVQLPPQESDERIDKAAVPEEERKEATVIVFADVDLLSDQVAFQRSLFGTQAANDNYKVFLNAVDYLLGSEALMKVRGKRVIEHPFTLFDEIEAQADRDTLDREKAIREKIAGFQKQLQEKQSSLGQKNAALFQKELQDEVDRVNQELRDAQRQLREIRKERRRALEKEEAKVRFATLWTTPSLVLVLGLSLFVRRKNRERKARRSQP